MQCMETHMVGKHGSEDQNTHTCDRCGNSYTCNTIKEADSYHKTNYIRDSKAQLIWKCIWISCISAGRSLLNRSAWFTYAHVLSLASFLTRMI